MSNPNQPSGRGAARLARVHGVQEVGGSNPLAPTKTLKVFKTFRVSFYLMTETSFLPPINRKALLAFILSLLAVVAFCVGVLPIPFTALLCDPPGILAGVAAFLLGVRSLREIRQSGERGRALAMIAMWVSGLLTLLTLCFVISGILLWPHVVEFFQQIWSQVTY